MSVGALRHRARVKLAFGVPPGQLVRFASAGTAATATHYLMLILLVELAGVNPTVASVIGYGVSWVVNYSLNRRFTFKSARPHREALGRFVSVGVMALLLNSTAMAIATAVGIHYLVAQVLATSLVFCWTFTCNRLWTFAAVTR